MSLTGNASNTNVENKVQNLSVLIAFHIAQLLSLHCSIINIINYSINPRSTCAASPCSSRALAHPPVPPLRLGEQTSPRPLPEHLFRVLLGGQADVDVRDGHRAQGPPGAPHGGEWLHALATDQCHTDQERS